MKKIMRWIINEESGQGMVEYSLIIALVAISLVFSLKTLGDKLQLSIIGSANNIP